MSNKIVWHQQKEGKKRKTLCGPEHAWQLAHRIFSTFRFVFAVAVSIFAAIVVAITIGTIADWLTGHKSYIDHNIRFDPLSKLFYFVFLSLYISSFLLSFLCVCCFVFVLWQLLISELPRHKLIWTFGNLPFLGCRCSWRDPFLITLQCKRCVLLNGCSCTTLYLCAYAMYECMDNLSFLLKSVYNISLWHFWILLNYCR